MSDTEIKFIGPSPHPGPSPYDIDRMTDIVAGHGHWFSAELLRLIAKADLENRERIRVMFPHHVSAYENWANR